MKLEQMQTLQNIMNNLPVSQSWRIQVLAMENRPRTIIVGRWKAHCDLVSMYMNFPFLY